MTAEPPDANTVAVDLDATGSANAYGGDAAFHRFYALLSPPGDRGTPAVFVHELRTPGGQPRLVVVQSYITLSMGDDGGGEFGGARDALTLSFQARVFRPGGIGRPATEVLTNGSGSVMVAVSRPARIYAGQHDAGDPAHFTFTGTFNEQGFAVDGWLGADDAVTMQIRRSTFTPARPPGTPRRTVGP